MTVYFTADTHFFHANAIRHDGRPYGSVREMNDALVENWNSVVTNSDTVYHLGDFAWRAKRPMFELLVRSLNGAKHWIYGNHDDKRVRPADGFVSKGYYDRVRFHVRGVDQWIVLCHYAMRTWHGSSRGTWMLYGHSHGKLPVLPGAKTLDVGVMCWNYRPVSIETIADRMAEIDSAAIPAPVCKTGG